jgi:hypothetical protein
VLEYGPIKGAATSVYSLSQSAHKSVLIKNISFLLPET